MRNRTFPSRTVVSLGSDIGHGKMCRVTLHIFPIDLTYWVIITKISVCEGCEGEGKTHGQQKQDTRHGKNAQRQNRSLHPRLTGNVQSKGAANVFLSYFLLNENEVHLATKQSAVSKS